MDLLFHSNGVTIVDWETLQKLHVKKKYVKISNTRGASKIYLTPNILPRAHALSAIIKVLYGLFYSKLSYIYSSRKQCEAAVTT